MKIEDLKNGKVRITPDNGKILFCSIDNKTHSEAIAKKESIKYFTEIKRKVKLIWRLILK